MKIKIPLGRISMETNHREHEFSNCAWSISSKYIEKKIERISLIEYKLGVIQ